MIAVVQFMLVGNAHPVFVADGNEGRIRIGARVGTIGEDDRGWYALRAAAETYRTPGGAAERELKEWLNAKAK